MRLSREFVNAPSILRFSYLVFRFSFMEYLRSIRTVKGCEKTWDELNPLLYFASILTLFGGNMENLEAPIKVKKFEELHHVRREPDKSSKTINWSEFILETLKFLSVYINVEIPSKFWRGEKKNCLIFLHR